jgi:hypothetical protein
MTIRMKLVLALACVTANAGLTSVHAQSPLVRTGQENVPVQVDTGELLGAVPAEIIRIDVHNDPIGFEWQPGDPIREIPRRHWDDPALLAAIERTPVNPVAPGLDALAARQQAFDAQHGQRGGGFAVPLLNFEGAPGTTLPPDPTGDIGPAHYVQAVNASGGTRVRVFNKTDGAMVGNFILNAQLAGTGACASGLGDPIVVYDALADRWVLTEFSSSSGRSLCVYISASNDPLGTVWYRYAFQMPAFPDYPKYGVWSDAYYVTANESGTANARPVYAFERAAMLTGATARFVRLTIPRLAGFGFQLLTPVHHVGLDAPPAGAPGLYMRHVDDESHFAGSNDPTKDYLQLWSLAMNWSLPTPGTVLTGPVQIDVAEFSSNLNGLTAFNAFPQPNGQKLDPLREPIMNVLMYRNFGAYEVIVGNLVTDVDAADTGGVRWFELRRSGGIGNPWQLFQEGTYAPADAGGPADRWMAGIGVDSSGNLALAYSVTRQTPGIFASLRYVGRLAGDAPGVMTTPETEFATGARNQSNERWGDYHQMGVDPIDGCTFWFTGEYMGPAGSTNNTRVAAFRHDECGDPTFTLNTSISTYSVCAGGPSPVLVPPITVNVGSVNGFNSPVSLAYLPLPAGISGSLTPNVVTALPGSSIASLSIAGPATPGDNTITIEGTSGTIIKSKDVLLKIATVTPDTIVLSAPANGAVNVPVSATLSWTASAQATSYVVEVASDAAFATLVFTGTVNNGTSVAVTPALQTNTTYYWRVRGSNICGTSTDSAVFSFRTVPAPGDCDSSTLPIQAFSENFNAGAGGFTVSTGTGTANWALSTARPSPLSGGNAFKADGVAVLSDQRLTSPAIALPAGQNPLTLRYQNWRLIEMNGATGCYDGGILELSANGGAFAQVTGVKLLNDPYRGAVSSGFSSTIAGLNAWCDNPTRPYGTDSLVDLSEWAGQSVQLRWRFATDSSTSTEGWYVDDVRVQSCAIGDTIFADGFDPSP